MSWRAWGLDHCHGLKVGVAHRLDYYISGWYCGWTLEGLQYSFQPKLPTGVPDLGHRCMQSLMAASMQPILSRPHL